MAAAIERNLGHLLPNGLPPDDTAQARDRRRLFAAIARGVIEHMAAHPEALTVVFTNVPAGENVGDFHAHVHVDVSAW